MPLDSGKKIIILYILNILRKYTDAGHTMTQQEIADKTSICREWHGWLAVISRD